MMAPSENFPPWHTLGRVRGWKITVGKISLSDTHRPTATPNRAQVDDTLLAGDSTGKTWTGQEMKKKALQYTSGIILILELH